MKSRLTASLFAWVLATLLPVFSHAYEPPETLYEYLGTVSKVVDGNTLEINVDMGFQMWRHNTNIRLKGVDVPKPTGDTLQDGVKAFEYLRETLKDQERVLLRTFWDPTGQFDGWLAELSIWDDDKEAWVSVNQMVIDSGHGKSIEE